MSDHKFEISFWGIKISAPGPAGISAAVLAVCLLLYRLKARNFGLEAFWTVSCTDMDD
ncbi:hypothetical protein [Bradyrhizobium liaoningense]|uniref:hypothetical protein n=1 Tax=Bradyrhizobium liaoningense TaxID=43992 RepID=UPI0004AD9EBA|nr:hypothetical protein [Bradyrhizobium liaoningense]